MEKEEIKLNIYEKIQIVKEEFLKEKVKKSGKNKFAGYTYYELADITPVLIKLCNKARLFTKVSYDKEQATLTIVNIDNPSEFETYTSPMEELELKGCNKIQALGGTETYQRRYLYMIAFDIIENDMFDATISEEKPEPSDRLKLLVEYKKLVNETNTDEDKVRENYKVEKIDDMTNDQFQEAINIMKSKLGDKKC